MNKLAIVSVSFNGSKDTRELLESGRKLELKGYEAKWIIVDNGSDTDPIPIEWEKEWGIELIQAGANLGFAGGYNLGMKYAYRWGADLVLIVNNDVLFGDNKLIAKLTDAINKPGVGVVSPKILFAKGFEFQQNKYSKSDLGQVIWYAGGEFDWNNITTKHRGIDEVDTNKYDKVEQVDFISGCCVLVKKEYLEKVGYFKDELFAYYEDADWVERGKIAGFKQMYAGNTWVYHKVSRTSGIGSPTTDYLLTRNRLWFGMKYARIRTKFALLRESVRLLIQGRQMQKMGVLDNFRNKFGGPRKSFAVERLQKYPIELSIVILNYKTSKLLEALLKSIYANPVASMEVVVLDNSPEDDCVDVVKKYPQIKFIQVEKNIGFPAGNNAAIEYTRGRYVLLLNSDIEVVDDGLNKIVAAAQNLLDRAVMVGRLRFGDGHLQDSCFYLPTVWGAIQEYFLGKKGKYFMFRPSGDSPVQVEGGVMACFLIPRKVLNRVGKLWDRAFIYFEDIEYCRRLKQHNVPIYYVPDAVFVHHHGSASKEAGVITANAWLVEASKKYHGIVNYGLLYLILWLGQKVGKVVTPKARWKNPQ